MHFTINVIISQMGKENPSGNRSGDIDFEISNRLLSYSVLVNTVWKIGNLKLKVSVLIRLFRKQFGVLISLVSYRHSHAQ